MLRSYLVCLIGFLLALIAIGTIITFVATYVISSPGLNVRSSHHSGLNTDTLIYDHPTSGSSFGQINLIVTASRAAIFVSFVAVVILSFIGLIFCLCRFGRVMTGGLDNGVDTGGLSSPCNGEKCSPGANC